IFEITFRHFKGKFPTPPRALYIIQPLFRGKKPPENTRIYKLVQKCFGIFSKTFAEQKTYYTAEPQQKNRGVNRHGLSNAYTHDSGKRRNGDCR
ncbi:MAG: hypothetical protein SPH64_04420, partial [Eubacteriales bacterium]|nr:hypothetical protein [Eubacteriales bacterium]